MRFLDRWLGIPLCWVLSGVRAVRGDGPAASATPRRILLIKLSEAGCLVLARKLVQRLLSEAGGGAELSMLTFKENRAALLALGYVDSARIMVVDRENPAVFLRDVLRLLLRLRRDRFDVVIDLEFFSRLSAAVAFLSAAPQRVGFRDTLPRPLYRGDLFTVSVPYRPEMHTEDLFGDFAEAAGINGPVRVSWPACVPGTAGLSRMQARLRAEGTAEGCRIILVHPGDGTIPARDWPLSYTGDLCCRLLSDPRNLVILVGQREAARRAVKIGKSLAHAQRLRSYAAGLAVDEFLALCSLSALLIGPDSGLAHLASLTAVKKIVMFGPESPARFAPRDGRTSVLYRALPCSPCLSMSAQRVSRCPHNRCLKDIPVDEVFVLAQALLACTDEGGEGAP